MLSIYLNDIMHQIEPSQSLHDILMQTNYLEQPIAVALNNTLVPRIAYRTTHFLQGDRVDIIVPMQGG
jgi:thiamine biosynthesis protein ThiS